MKSIPSDHPVYRPDIDGLRAVAVLCVIIFHARPAILPSGFVGVDIFFVISGFLISSILFKAVEQGSFTFTDFYSRRIKRIFPALVLVMVSCLSMGYFVLFADEYQMLGKHVASGAVFLSNFTLLNESGYFDPAAELKPLLHLWSLGIEEQFYIVWPLLIYVAAKLRINWLVMTILLAVLSFGLNIWRIDAHLVQTFYGPLTRFWELMFGSILAYVSIYPSVQISHYREKFANFVAITGLVLIISALFLLNNTKLFPGWWAVLPTVGAVLLIAAGPSAWVNKNVLAIRPLVFIGFISYPLYLWHYPLLSFLRIVESGNPTISLVLIAIVAAVLLAWLTYVLVEKRIRHQSSLCTVIGLVLLVAISGFIGKVIQKKNGFPDRSSVVHYKEYEKQMIREVAIDVVCLEYIQQNGNKILFDYCRASNLKAEKWVAIIGDSHAHVLFPGFSKEFEKRDVGTILFANSNCPPFIGTVTGKTDTEIEGCSNKIEQILSTVASEKRIEKVVIATRGPVYITGLDSGPGKNMFNPAFQIKSRYDSQTDASRELFFNGLYRTINYIIKSDKEVSYFLENPELAIHPKNCLGRPFTFKADPPECNVDFNIYKSRMSEYRAGVLEIRNKFSNLMILDTEPLFCDTANCRFIFNDKLLYADADHLSVEGSILVAKEFVSTILTNTRD